MPSFFQGHACGCRRINSDFIRSHGKVIVKLSSCARHGVTGVWGGGGEKGLSYTRSNALCRLLRSRRNPPPPRVHICTCCWKEQCFPCRESSHDAAVAPRLVTTHTELSQILMQFCAAYFPGSTLKKKMCFFVYLSLSVLGLQLRFTAALLHIPVLCDVFPRSPSATGD